MEVLQVCDPGKSKTKLLVVWDLSEGKTELLEFGEIKNEVVEVWPW